MSGYTYHTVPIHPYANPPCPFDEHYNFTSAKKIISGPGHCNLFLNFILFFILKTLFLKIGKFLFQPFNILWNNIKSIFTMPKFFFYHNLNDAICVTSRPPLLHHRITINKLLKISLTGLDKKILHMLSWKIKMSL